MSGLCACQSWVPAGQLQQQQHQQRHSLGAGHRHGPPAPTALPHAGGSQQVARRTTWPARQRAAAAAFQVQDGSQQGRPPALAPHPDQHRQHAQQQQQQQHQEEQHQLLPHTAAWQRQQQQPDAGQLVAQPHGVLVQQQHHHQQQQQQQQPRQAVLQQAAAAAVTAAPGALQQPVGDAGPLQRADGACLDHNSTSGHASAPGAQWQQPQARAADRRARQAAPRGSTDVASSSSACSSSSSGRAGRPVKRRDDGPQRTHGSRPQQPHHSSSSSSSRGGGGRGDAGTAWRPGQQQQQGMLASRALTGAISKSACWQELQALLAAEGGRMNHIHAAALLARTSRLVSYHALAPRDAGAFADFYVAALQLAFVRAQDGSAGPRELSSMLWAVARVGLHPGADWLAAYLGAAAPQLPAMNAQDLGLLVWALARFKHAPEPRFRDALLAAARRQLAATIGGGWQSGQSSGSSKQGGGGGRGLDAQGLSNMVWGLAVLDLSPGQEWLAAAVAAAEVMLRRHRQMQPQGLAVLLWALARLGHRPGQAWLQVAADAAAAQLRAFKPAELAMLCHALARLHYVPEQQQQQPEHEQLELEQPEQKVPPLQPAQQQQPLLQQVVAVVAPHLQCLHFAEAANLLWGLAVMGQRPPAAWLDAALLRLRDTLQEADGKAVASACYALAKLQHQPPGAWWEALWQQLQRVLGSTGAGAVAFEAPAAGANGSSSSSSSSSLSGDGSGSSFGEPCAPADSQTQATLLLALAKLGARLPGPVAAQLLAASEQQLQAGAPNGAEVVGMAMAAAKLRLQPPASWLAALEAHFEALLQRSCLPAAPTAPASVAAQLHAQLQLDCAPGTPGAPSQQQLQLQQQQQQQHVAALPASALAHPPLKPTEVANTLLSLARLRHVPRPAAVAAARRYVQQHDSCLCDADREQLGRALQSLSDQRSAREAAAAAAAQLRAAQAAAAAARPDCTCGTSSGNMGLLEHAGACCSPGSSSLAAAAAVTLRADGSAAADVGAAQHVSSNGSSHGPLHGLAAAGAHAPAAGALRQHHHQQQHDTSVAGAAAAAAAAAAQDEWALYGTYLRLEVRGDATSGFSVHREGAGAPLGSTSSRSGSAGGSGGPSISRRRKALASVTQQALLLAGGLSVAAS